ncbi:SRPBCC family protein [Paenibacillus sp. UMB7766-LJ446]|uniref:SRPBCC family protein n=1 Tax=Paenibacillus sp. UMB7766-LJ446 TaxID=3046313 RepID=UPI00254D1D28|nr:SRPBCC family protein [Paenibacillus sp. UMB7766-LJ446]MDK8189223.1 SRPBCC family protein [Paenibacillus sp. UMB7766-LJ446]
MMNEYGTLHESNGRYALKFERFLHHNPEDAFLVITKPSCFSQWYPFATGEMDLRLGGRIAFDDGEGTTYEGIITELEKPYVFGFREVDDLINILLQEEDKGCRMIFTHTSNDASWAVNTAAGWHRCLDVLVQIINGKLIQWHDNPTELRKIYSEVFNMEG